ncbi:MAG: hypothetical protein GY756_19600, partial [bacterium]|nr:hypothetical protein [bacterium]
TITVRTSKSCIYREFLYSFAKMLTEVVGISVKSSLVLTGVSHKIILLFTAYNQAISLQCFIRINIQSYYFLGEIEKNSIKTTENLFVLFIHDVV